jgi:hypothetical protein
MKQENKSITVSKTTITVNYHDSNKHFSYKIEKGDPNRDIKLFGKEFKGVKASSIKKDFLKPGDRELFNDLVYARKRMSHFEIEKLPLYKKQTIKVTAKQVERVLNNWKTEIVSKKVDSLLMKLFPNSPVVKQMVDVQYDEKENLYQSSFSIHSIATEEQIAEYLYEKGLFPKFK